MPGVVDRVVGREVRAAGIPEYDVDTSALRHSMIASTARIIACSNLLPLLVVDREQRA
jgi:hypothetical protein